MKVPLAIIITIIINQIPISCQFMISPYRQGKDDHFANSLQLSAKRNNRKSSSITELYLAMIARISILQ